MNAQRLQVLSRYLRNLNRVTIFDRVKALFGISPPKKKAFNMYIWSCDTAACALGTACVIPEFNRAGLVAALVDEEADERHAYGNRMFHAIPEFEGCIGFSAGASFFGISYSSACRLFDPELYALDVYSGSLEVTPEMVADRIDELIANGGELRPKFDEPNSLTSNCY